MQGWLRENCRKGGIAEDSRNSFGIKENCMKDNKNKKEVAKVILVLAVIIVACICGQLFVGCSPRITPLLKSETVCGWRFVRGQSMTQRMWMCRLSRK